MSELVSGLLKEMRNISNELSALNASVNKRVASAERSIKRLEYRMSKQDADIDDLKDAVAKLLEREETHVWKSRDGHEVGIDRDTAYDEFRKVGASPKSAMQMLVRERVVVPDTDHNCKNVRRGGKVIRAVVIYR